MKNDSFVIMKVSCWDDLDKSTTKPLSLQKWYNTSASLVWSLQIKDWNKFKKWTL